MIGSKRSYEKPNVRDTHSNHEEQILSKEYIVLRLQYLNDTFED
jgi:hypothetical protein